MEIINLTEEQKGCLCSELAKLTSEFKKDETVECAYFAPYVGVDNVHIPALLLTLVTKNDSDKNKISVRQYNRLYKRPENIEKYGIKILVNVDDSEKYSFLAMKLSELARTNNLFNSSILFDKTGKYTRIKEYTQNQLQNRSEYIYYYENLANVFPPITEEVQDKCKKLG